MFIRRGGDVVEREMFRRKPGWTSRALTIADKIPQKPGKMRRIRERRQAHTGSLSAA